MAAENKPAWVSAFEARTDLDGYGSAALGLFALALRFNLEDLETVAAESLTEGGNDKKCDIVYIDRDDRIAVIAQTYVRPANAKPKSAAPANKASDLNAAVNWLLISDPNELPDSIRFSAIELREAIRNGEISKLHIWYVHNLAESKNVADELKVVEASAQTALKSLTSKSDIPVHCLEVGQDQFAEWYSDTQSPILVNDAIEVIVDGGFEEKGNEWDAYVTSIPLQFLRSQYLKHSTKLFSANVRDYLGSISSENNVNNGIRKTAEADALNFWPYNNGLTILVNEIDPKKLKNGRIKLNISGISIVNGAQTTGAIGTLRSAPPKEAKVSARFIRTPNTEILYDIIRFNNSQNKIAAADFRSTDSIQKRLRKDMAEIPNAQYDGGRRGGPTDAIKRRPNLLPAYTVGQALAAVHGDATVAYNKKSDIWADDGLYNKYFNEHTTARHIVFSFGLLRTVEERKNALMQKAKSGGEELSESEERQLSFFRRRGSTFLFVSAVSACLETILGKAIPNRFRLSFGPKTSPKKASQNWDDVVDALLPLSTHLEEAFTYGLQNQERLKKAIATFTSLVEATSTANKPIYQKFAKSVSSKV